jgi:hypothetical protein
MTMEIREEGQDHRQRESADWGEPLVSRESALSWKVRSGQSIRIRR